MVECSSCHTTTPTNYVGGPHGMHPVGSAWVSAHPDFTDRNGSAQCQACHGTDYRGTVLSRMQADRTLSAFGAKTFFRGAMIGCYTCHSGPGNDSSNSSTPPVVNNVSGSTPNNTPLSLPVTITPTTATLRIISQPVNGSLGVSNNVLTYFPNAGFAGSDTFTYAAWDTSKNSNLATGTVSVVQGPYSLSIVSHVATNAPTGWPVAFAVVPTVTNNSSAVTFNWNFGDGSASSTNQFAQHIFITSGTFWWRVVATVGSASATNIGNLLITAPVALALATPQNAALSLAWPSMLSDVVVEQSATLGSGAQWMVVTNLPVAGPVNSSVNLPVGGGNRFFRLRQPW
jgi:hypothetical protein